MIYGIYRTNRESDSISLITSPDMGKTWSTPTNVKGSIQCRPRIINYANSILYAYNIYNGETQHRPAVYGGRTNVQLRLGTDFTNNDNNKLVADVHSIYGISNIAVIDIVGDVYMAYGTSVSALDYQTRLSVCDDVSHILTSEKKTAILVTHDISEAISLSDRIVVLTERPARVKNVHTLHLRELGSPLQRREHPDFSRWFETLWRELNK